MGTDGSRVLGAGTPQAWAPEPPECCSWGDLGVWQCHRHIRALRLLAGALDAGHHTGQIRFARRAWVPMLPYAQPEASSPTQITARTTQQRFCYLCATGLPGADKQPGLKRCFCKLNSAGPKDYHCVHYIPRIFHLSLARRSGARVGVFARLCESTVLARPAQPLGPLLPPLERWARGPLCPGTDAWLQTPVHLTAGDANRGTRPQGRGPAPAPEPITMSCESWPSHIRCIVAGLFLKPPKGSIRA